MLFIVQKKIKRKYEENKKVNRKDYLNISHLKKKKKKKKRHLSSTCDLPIIEFIVFMWKQCF